MRQWIADATGAAETIRADDGFVIRSGDGSVTRWTQGRTAVRGVRVSRITVGCAHVVVYAAGDPRAGQTLGAVVGVLTGFTHVKASRMGAVEVTGAVAGEVFRAVLRERAAFLKDWRNPRLECNRGVAARADFPGEGSLAARKVIVGLPTEFRGGLLAAKHRGKVRNLIQIGLTGSRSRDERECNADVALSFGRQLSFPMKRDDVRNAHLRNTACGQNDPTTIRRIHGVVDVVSDVVDDLDGLGHCRCRDEPHEVKFERCVGPYPV